MVNDWSQIFDMKLTTWHFITKTSGEATDSSACVSVKARDGLLACMLFA